MTTTTMEAPAVKLLEWFGTWAGRVLLGPILPPAGGIAGGLIGKQLGGMAGRALSSAMSGANDDATPKEAAKDDTETCETCRTKECQKLEDDINRRMYGNVARLKAANLREAITDSFQGEQSRFAVQVVRERPVGQSMLDCSINKKTNLSASMTSTLMPVALVIPMKTSIGATSLGQPHPASILRHPTGLVRTTPNARLQKT